MKVWLLACIFLLSFSGNSFSQDVTGIWNGYFISDNGEQYKLEFQVKQNETLSVQGVSYSYLDIRFYGKATMTGSFVKTSKRFRIKEIRTVEVKSTTGGGTCIMNYDLTYSRSGNEEYLEGSYLGKQEVKGKENPYEWGDCGGGTVFLRRVVSSNFYVEPFLRKKDEPRITAPVQRDSALVKKDPVKKPPTTTTKTSTATTRKPVITVPTTRPTTRKVDTLAKQPTVVKIIDKPVISTPSVLKERSNELMKSLVVHSPEVTVKLYDNGEIDDDTISVFFDKKLLVSNKRLSASPITIKLHMDDEGEEHELVMVAENLGRIPPNTSLMIVEAGDQRFDVRITSTTQKNALVRFKYQQP
jgi:hypothetical protein